MSKIREQIQDLPIPYPQKKHLELEIEADPTSHQEGSHFQKEDLEELYGVHNNSVYKLLSCLRPTWKNRIETAIALVPLTILTVTYGKEKFMIEFIKEGGFGMLAILALSIPLFYRECMNIFRLILVKDHSKRNLKIDSSAVQIGCLAITFLGFAGTALGIYYTATAAIASPAHQDILIIGVKESLGNVILASAFASLILVMHYTSRSLLNRWQAPLP